MAIALLWGEPGYMIYNDAYAVIAGKRHPRLLGSEVRKGWPEVADYNDAVMRAVLGRGETISYRDRMLELDRTGSGALEPCWVDVDYSPVMGDDGARAGVIAFVIETTERVRAAEALRESEARLRFLDALQVETARSLDAGEVLATTTRMTAQHLGASVCAYADMDEDQDGFTILGDWAAEGSASIVGRYRLADFGSRAVRELGAGRPLIVEDVARDLEPEAAATFLGIGIGATICMPLVIEGRLTALMAVHHRGPRAWTEGELATVREVTQRSWAHVERAAAAAALREANAELERRVEERTRQLRDSQEFTRLALQAVGGVGVWSYDVLADRVVFDANVAALYGHTVEEGEQGLTRADFLRHVHPEDLGRVVQGVDQRLASVLDQENEYRILPPDGRLRWVLARGRVTFDAQGRAARRAGVAIDMTRQRLLEEQFRQSQKMEAVGQLTGGIAHDFNNLLTGITGSLEMLQARVAQGRLDALDRYVGAAQGAARRAAALTHRLLAFSRRQTLDPKPIDLNRLVVGMEELVRRTVGPSIAIEVVRAGGLWAVNVDPNQLENALLNLCINARDAMPEGGRITIETANKWLDERAAAERDLEAGQYVSLCVSDTGHGMTEEVAARAFDPFFTTKPLGQGTGLGLSMIYGFVRQSGGQVRIYSEPGSGTTMCLYFPRDRAEAVNLEAAATPLAPVAPDGAGEVVLVIDDEPTIRMLIAEVLEGAGYHGIEAGDGPSGLKVLQSGARIDLLITDVGLPGGMNGRQIADAARALRPGLKVLFITGYAENAAVGNGFLDPGMEVLTKPFALDALSQRLRRMLKG